MEGLKYPLAADSTKKVAVITACLSKIAVSHCAVFVIDPEGILRYKVVHDLNVGRSAEETLRVIQALQTGGLCQAEWKAGDTQQLIRLSTDYTDCLCNLSWFWKSRHKDGNEDWNTVAPAEGATGGLAARAHAESSRGSPDAGPFLVGELRHLQRQPAARWAMA